MPNLNKLVMVCAHDEYCVESSRGLDASTVLSSMNAAKDSSSLVKNLISACISPRCSNKYCYIATIIHILIDDFH